MVAKSMSGFQAREVETSQLVNSPVNARREVGDISELADSIREQGILEPLVVRPAEGGTFEVIIGSRRLACARQLDLPVVPVVIQRISDADAVVRSLVENLHRGDLTLDERVEAYRRLHRFDPAKYGTTRGLAKAIGRTHTKIVEDFQAYEAMQRLRSSGVEVASKMPPGAAQRRSRAAIPEHHATMLEQAMTAMRSRIQEDKIDSTYEQLARAIAPLEQDRARRLLEYFKMYPEKPVAEIESMALATVEREISLPAETAKQIEDMASQGGNRNWGEVITRLVESRAPDQGLPPAPDDDREANRGQSPVTVQQPEAKPPQQLPISQEESPTTQDQSPATDGEPQPAEESPAPQEVKEGPITVQYELLGSPEEVTSAKLTNRLLWNLEHASLDADFYTIGYAGRELDEFVAILRAAAVTTLVDIRHSRVSPYNPEFSDGNLEGALEGDGIEYVHRPDLGVPHELPSHARSPGTMTSWCREYRSMAQRTLLVPLAERWLSWMWTPIQRSLTDTDSSSPWKKRSYEDSIFRSEDRQDPLEIVVEHLTSPTYSGKV